MFRMPRGKTKLTPVLSYYRLYFREIEYVFHAHLGLHLVMLTVHFDSWTRYKINRPAFHRKYTQFFESMKSHPTNPPLNGDMLKWLPLMFIVVSIKRTALSDALRQREFPIVGYRHVVRAS